MNGKGRIVRNSQARIRSEQSKAGRFIWEQFLAGKVNITQITRSGSYVFTDLGGSSNAQSVDELKARLTAMAVGRLSRQELDRLFEEDVGYLKLIEQLPDAAGHARFAPVLSTAAKRLMVLRSVADFSNDAVAMENRHHLRGDGCIVSAELHGLNKLEALFLVTDVLGMRDMEKSALCVGAGVEHGELRLEPLLRLGLRLRGYVVEYLLRGYVVEYRHPALSVELPPAEV